MAPLPRARRAGRSRRRVGRVGCRRGWSCAAPLSRPRLPRPMSTGSSPICRSAGYRVELRRAPSGNLLGHKLARPGDTTAAGEPVFYSGSKLAPDLSLPRLLQRWASTPSARGAGRMPGASDVLEAVAAARAAVRAGGENPDGIGAATADLLTALAAGHGTEGWG